MLVSVGYGQSIGIRAGLNFSNFNGPTEEFESYGIASGFHFGFSYGYRFTSQFMLSGELLYNQIGTKHNYDGEGVYFFRMPDFIVERGQLNINKEITMSYVALPIIASYKLGKKIEFLGGISPAILLSPSANGLLQFISTERPEENYFRQTLDYNYSSDRVRGARELPGRNPVIFAPDLTLVSIPGAAGAYYQYDDKPGNKMNWFDITLVGGLNYFINKGLFIGVRVERGLIDVIRNDMHRSYRNYNTENNSMIMRNTKEYNFGFQTSVGFRF
jgi:hypothetical protein